MYRNKALLSYSEVLSKLMRYCSYQERSMFEVKQKLKTFQLKSSDQDLIVEHLEKENFLNELRFAETYVRGKVKVKKWGVYKIREGLAAKGVGSEIVNRVIKGIDQELYLNNLEEISIKKANTLEGDAKLKEKLYRFLLSRGYESEWISKSMKRL